VPSKKTPTKTPADRDTTTVNMNRALHKEANLERVKQGVTLQALVEEAVRQYLSALKKRA
jgi:predicted HicB family RNase H-like nuclease